METIIKTTKVTKDVIKAIEEVKRSTKEKGVTSKGFKFIKTLTQIILL